MGREGSGGHWGGRDKGGSVRGGVTAEGKRKSEGEGGAGGKVGGERTERLLGEGG